MEQYTKPPLNILRRLDSASTHPIIVFEIWALVELWTRCAVFVCLFLDLCVCHCCDSSSWVCFYSLLTLVVFIVINIVRVRGSNLWRFLTKRTSAIRKKIVVFKWIIGSLERGWVQPSSIGTPQRGIRQVFYLAEPRDKNRCITCYYSCAILSASTHLIIALSSNTHLVKSN
jgi:hypothetical protein